MKKSSKINLNKKYKKLIKFMDNVYLGGTSIIFSILPAIGWFVVVLLNVSLIVENFPSLESNFKIITIIFYVVSTPLLLSLVHSKAKFYKRTFFITAIIISLGYFFRP